MYEKIIPGRLDTDAPFQVQITGYSYCDGSYEIRRRVSPIHCIEYIISGTGTVIEDGREFTASAGDVYILHRGHSHRYFSDENEPWVKVWMNVAGELADQLIEVYGLGKVRHIRAAEGVEALFRRFVEVAEGGQQGNEIDEELEIIFHKIIFRLYSIINERREEKSDSLAARIKRELDGAPGGIITLDEVAARLYCSKSYAIKVFCAEYGVTPYEYLLRQRIRVAKLLLRNSNEPIGRIAEQLGFCDSHYFSGFFRSRTGMSPMKYRKAEQNKEKV